MLDDFFVRALVVTIGLAIISGPLGCFVVWRRMAYFGDTMAHSALLGVALSFLLEIEPVAGVFITTLLVAVSLFVIRRHVNISNDSILGILSHSSLALGLVLLSVMSWLRVNISALLFGDVLAVSVTDIVVVYSVGLVIIITMCYLWRSLITATLHFDIAQVEGMKPLRADFIFMVLLAGVIAVAMKIVGVLLITSLLIIPAAIARYFVSGPEQMAVLASVLAIVASITGLFGSLYIDTPSTPSIVVVMFCFFVLSVLIKETTKRLGN